MPENFTVIELLNSFTTMFFMTWLAITDFYKFKLPNKIIGSWIICRTALIAASVVAEGSLSIVFSSIGGAVFIGTMLLAIHLLSKEMLGGGDVKLGFAMGFALMFEAAFLAVVLGLLFAAAFEAFRILLRSKNLMSNLPLGVFLFFGVIGAYVLNYVFL